MNRVFFLILCFCTEITFGKTALPDSLLVRQMLELTDLNLKSSKNNDSNSNKFFVQLGINCAAYSKSDIKFQGSGYNFTLKDVKGNDQPAKGSLQYNIHLGYYLNNTYSIYLGLDHMKYVMDVPQQVKISGFIESSVSKPGISTGQYEGVYNDETITVNPDLLTLEYTDGFNYAKLGVSRQDNLLASRKGKSTLKLTTGLAGGLIIPRSDVRLFTVGKNNKMNIAGWATSVNAGLKFYLNESLYLQGSVEAGYSNLFKVHTTGRNNVDKAGHKLYFLQNYWLIGFQF